MIIKLPQSVKNFTHQLRSVGINWRLHFIIFALLNGLFWFTALDLQLVELLYDAGNQHWLFAKQLWVTAAYKGVHYFVAASLLACLSVWLIAWLLPNAHPRWSAASRFALYYFLVLLLASGLIVNALFKDHWGRQRPAQIVGEQQVALYTPPMQYVSHSNGRSFPSGHASVAWSLFAMWWWLRRRHHPWQNRALVLATAVVIWVGAARMVAGGHFLSDIVWAGWLNLLVIITLHYWLYERK